LLVANLRKETWSINRHPMVLRHPVSGHFKLGRMGRRCVINPPPYRVSISEGGRALLGCNKSGMAVAEEVEAVASERVEASGGPRVSCTNTSSSSRRSFNVTCLCLYLWVIRVLWWYKGICICMNMNTCALTHVHTHSRSRSRSLSRSRSRSSPRLRRRPTRPSIHPPNHIPGSPWGRRWITWAALLFVPRLKFHPPAIAGGVCAGGEWVRGRLQYLVYLVRRGGIWLVGSIEL